MVYVNFTPVKANFKKWGVIPAYGVEREARLKLEMRGALSSEPGSSGRRSCPSVYLPSRPWVESAVFELDQTPPLCFA